MKSSWILTRWVPTIAVKWCFLPLYMALQNRSNCGHNPTWRGLPNLTSSWLRVIFVKFFFQPWKSNHPFILYGLAANIYKAIYRNPINSTYKLAKRILGTRGPQPQPPLRPAKFGNFRTCGPFPRQARGLLKLTSITIFSITLSLCLFSIFFFREKRPCFWSLNHMI